jgi:mono/diheme cytochrome c family protein
MNKAVGHMFLSWILFFILSGSPLWAHGDKHQEEKKKQIQMRHWAAPSEERDRINPIPLSNESVLHGQTLYIQNCTDCHGINADGMGPDAEDMEPKPSNLEAMAGHHSDGDMAWKIKKGRGPMPAWEDILSKEQIWNLVNFIQNLKGKN